MFLTPMVLQVIPQADLWIFEAPLVWSDPVFGTLEVPPGFVTDLASIPRLLRNLPDFDPDGISRRPAGMHDWLFGSKEGRAHGKEFADRFLQAALISEGATRPVALAYYLAVHWFGGAGWQSDGLKL